MWSMSKYRKKLLGRYNNPLTLSPLELLLLHKWTKIKIEAPTRNTTGTTPRRKLRRPLREPQAKILEENQQTSFNDSSRVY